MKTQWKDIDTKTLPGSYKVIREEKISEVDSQAILLEHGKTGARVMVLHNGEKNKTFSISFRTPPEDGTGVAHIIEHTVLCGSRLFPAKDPFVELAKGSLSTFLNAMTFPDKTMYPVASCNDKDFQNLMHVYMDAVFFPNIYNKEEIFKQEGWHYELEDADAPIIYNGVVYNEMKGVFSSPEERLDSIAMSALFPDTPYAKESGGDPAEIPELTREEYLEFHRRYYHPSNSYIFLYGDMDVAEKLAWIDTEYLSKFDKLEIDSSIPIQEPFSEIQFVEESYAVSEGDGEEQTYLEYAACAGSALDGKTCAAMQILRKVLFGNAGAPVRRALLDAGIGDNVVAGFDNGIRQPMFEIEVKGARADKKDEFLQVIMDTVEQLVNEGLDKKSLTAAVNNLEFRVREGKNATYPAGILYAMDVMTTWLHDDGAAFDSLYYEDTLKFLRENIDSGYYENLLKTYILENTHAVVLALKPDKGLTRRTEEALAGKLAEKKAAMSEEEIQALIADTENLHRYQEEPSTKEELAALPMLTIEDISKKAVAYHCEEKEVKDVRLLHHDYFTKGISYVKLAFDIVPWKEYAPYISLLCSALGTLGTEHYNYLELANEEDTYTGGIGYNAVAAEPMDKEKGQLIYTFMVAGKALYGKENEMFRLMDEILFTSVLDDKKRLKEIIDSAVISKRNEFQESGHMAARRRALSYENEAGFIMDMMEGIGYYDFLCDLKANFEEKADMLVQVLRYLTAVMFRKERLLLSYTADTKGMEQAENALGEMIEKLEERENDSTAVEKPEAPVYPVMLQDKEEAFITPGQVQFNALTGNFTEKGYGYDGSLSVLSNLLNYNYLWNQVRVVGGAYGVFMQATKNGQISFVSFRDPKLMETYGVYEQVPGYLKEFEADEEEMTKCIIGAISNEDMPYGPAIMGSIAFSDYMAGVTPQMRQEWRNEILSTDVEKIRSLAPMLSAVMEHGKRCVIGSELKITDEKERFGHVEIIR